MSLWLSKPWQPCRDLDALPGHMGVFELGDERGAVLYVGYAGGHSRFGLRGAIAEAVDRVPGAVGVRYEVTTAYLTRCRELLMAHQAVAGSLPSGNDPIPGLGRLSPG